MTEKKIIIGLLGAVILAVGGYHLVAGDPEPEPVVTQSSSPRPAQSSALLQIPDDMAIIASTPMEPDLNATTISTPASIGSVMFSV